MARIAKHHYENLRDFGVPALASFIFLTLQSSGHMSELSLTAFIIAITLTTFYIRNHRHEPALFLIGVGIGAFIEIGLRIFGYQQAWTGASLFGVPYWLPIAWGIGFILITRLGILVRGVKTRG